MSVATAEASTRIREWRQLLAMADADAKWSMFHQAAQDLARLAQLGAIGRMDVADALTDMAASHNLADTDTVQTVLADAFNAVELEHTILDDEPQKTNGQVRAKKSKLPPIQSVLDFIATLQPPDYLIEGLLQRRFIYAFTGQTGHAKTAIALLIAQLVSSIDRNAVLGTHRVHKGRVIYLVGENPDDVGYRIVGNNSKRTDDWKRDDLWIIRGRFHIGEMMSVLVNDMAMHGNAVLIIVDTSAAYFLGQDENANQQIGQHAAMLRKLTELPGGPTVLVLCHPIKHAAEPSQLLPRGGGAFLAEMDGNLTAWKRDDGLIELNYTKLRGPHFEPMTFKLESFSAELKGVRYWTVRAMAVTQSDEDQATTKARADEDAVLAARLKVPDDQPLSMADIAIACEWTFADGSPAKSRVQNVVNRLVKSNHMRSDRGQYLLTEKGKEAARKAALKVATRKAADDQFHMGV